MHRSIGFFGNLCNMHYQACKGLRAHSDFDVHLYIDHWDAQRDGQTLPERDDPELLGNYPNWIHSGDYASPKYILAPFLSPLIALLNRHDIVVLTGSGPLFAPFLKARCIFYVAGGDLTVYPFPFQQWRRYQSLWVKAAALVRGFWQVLGIRQMETIWSQPFQPFVLAARRLQIERKVSPAYFPIMVDSHTFSPDPSSVESDFLSRQIARMKERFDFIILHPTRIIDEPLPHLVEAGEWKNNSLLLRGFREFLSENPGARAGLVFIDKSKPKGVYTDEEINFRRLIVNLGLTDHVMWLESKERDGFPRWELASIYRAAHVVVDEFGVGWFGCIVLEGLATGKPVICYVDEAAMATLYPHHPILSVNEPRQLGALLSHLFRDPDYARQVGQRSREWAARFHSGRGEGRHLAETFMKMLDQPVPAP